MLESRPSALPSPLSHDDLPDFTLTAGDLQLPTWVFARDSIRIRVQRLPQLRMRIESSEGHERAFDFTDIDELTAFQCGFEQHLIETGWSLIEFVPERRTAAARRRWWRRDRRRYPVSVDRA